MTGNGSPDKVDVLAEVVEPRRRLAGLSVRAAAERAGMSEGTWRRLAEAGAGRNDPGPARTGRRAQLLHMAQAVGCLEDVAARIGATASEVAEAEERVPSPDAGEAEILASGNYTDFEKLELLKTLRRARATGVD